MARSRRLLGADEYVVARLRPHAKVLLRPTLVLLAAATGVGAGVAAVPVGYPPLASAAVVVAGFGVVLAWSVVPFLRWRGTTFTVTNSRIFTRQGVLNRTGKDLPISRITDVAYERRLGDRVLGCGSLVISTAADDSPIRMIDVPDVRWVHSVLTELLLDRPAWAPPGGWPPPVSAQWAGPLRQAQDTAVHELSTPATAPLRSYPATSGLRR